MSDWLTMYADVSLVHGGLFVRDEGHYADVVEVTDLDSATGTTEMVMVEQGSCSIEYASSFAKQRELLAHALAACGPERSELVRMPRAMRRAAAYAALWSYGHGDTEHTHVLTTDRTAPRVQDGWEAEGRVNGSKGLVRWLRRMYDIEVKP